jgi:pyridoxamine 5'-phosphate oxidase
MEELATQYREPEVPRPPFWGGYRVIPLSIEFWQGQPNRLHDRLRYRRVDGDTWHLERLAP